MLIISNLLILFIAASYMYQAISNIFSNNFIEWRKKQWIPISIFSVPVISFIPFVMEITQTRSESNIGLMNALHSVLYTDSAGRVFVMLCALSVLTYLAYLRMDKTKHYYTTLPLSFGFLLIFTSQMNNEAFTYIGWQGYLLSVLCAGSLSVLIGVLLSIWRLNNESLKSGWLRRFNLFIGISVVFYLLPLIALSLQTVPEYITSLMLNYGQIMFIVHLLSIIFIFFIGRLFIQIYIGKAAIDSSQIQNTLRLNVIVNGILLGLFAILTTMRPAQEVLRTLEDEALNPIVNWLVGDELAHYQVIEFASGPSFILVIYLGFLLLLFSAVFILAIKFIPLGAGAAVTCIAAFYIGFMILIQPGDILVDNTVFHDEKTAIAASYNEEENFDILYREQQDDELILIYAIDNRDLGLEKLEVVDDGFKRTPLSGLVIEDALWGGQGQAMITRKIKEGYWLEDDKAYSYVSFGYVGQTENTEEVELELADRTIDIPVNENQVFFHIESDNESIRENYQTNLFDAEGNELASYQANSMTGSFHH